MAYYDVKRVEQAKNKAEEKHKVTLMMEACVLTVTECIKKSAEARKISSRINYSDIYNLGINSTFFGNPLPSELFSAYRCFLGFYFASFKVRTIKPKGKAVHKVMHQTKLFS